MNEDYFLLTENLQRTQRFSYKSNCAKKCNAIDLKDERRCAINNSTKWKIQVRNTTQQIHFPRITACLRNKESQLNKEMFQSYFLWKASYC